MNQNLNEEIIIHAKLRDNPQCITLEFKSRYSEQISEVFERGFEGFRKRINQEIFLPKNKSLFILTNETGFEYNLAESVGEKDGLQINNNISLVYFNLKSEIGQSDTIKNRINQLRQQIQGQEQQVQLIQFNPDIEKIFLFQIQEQLQLGKVQVQFTCSGDEQTIYQLKKKALERFLKQFPDMDILIEYDYFTIKNDINEYGINDNHQLVCELFQMQSEIELLLCLTGPINNDQLHKQFGKSFYKLVLMRQNINYVFQEFYQFIQTRGLQLDDQQVLAIENQILEASIEELQLTNVIKEETSDFIRKFAKATIDFTKKVSKTKIFLNTVPHVGRGLRVLKIFANNLKLTSKLSQGIKFCQLASSKTAYTIGAIALALEIGYLLYYQNKFSKSMLYKRMGAAVGKSVLGVYAYCNGYIVGGQIGAIVASAGMPTLMPIILGVIFGAAFALIIEYGLEKLLNYFWNDDQQINDVNFLIDQDKNECYFSALKTIGCEEKTLTSEIKKKRLQKLKELHPDKQNDQRDEFIKQYVAFQIVLSFRGEKSE